MGDVKARSEAPAEAFRSRTTCSGGAWWRRGLVPAAVTADVALLLALHGLVPNAPGNVGSLFETVLPWFGLAVPLAALAAVFGAPFRAPWPP